MLEKIRPHIYFDDQMFHVEDAAEMGTIAAHVPYGIAQKHNIKKWPCELQDLSSPQVQTRKMYKRKCEFSLKSWTRTIIMRENLWLLHDFFVQLACFITPLTEFIGQTLAQEVMVINMLIILYVDS